MKFLLFVILTFLVFSCENHNSYQPCEKQILANAIRKKLALQIKQELNLIPCGTAGEMLGQIKMLGLAFNCHKPLTIDDGRILLIAAVEKFTAEVNANEEIRPYLNNYPFKAKNIYIEIFIHRPDGSHFGSEKLCVISARDGVLEYLNDDPNGPLFTTVYSEIYEEALVKLKRDTSSSPLE